MKKKKKTLNMIRFVGNKAVSNERDKGVNTAERKRVLKYRN